ncbi:YybH family protein [Parafilimonas sp.]|uniref:YybH family protein n=1 Tax=Parafilimonas sp. TaxID=1969739 RepID=UPI0039E4B868
MSKMILACFLMAICVFCHAQTPADETAIRNAMDKQIEAWNHGDVDAFMKTYWKNDSLLFVSNPPTYGWQPTLDRYKQAYPDTAAMGRLSFNLLQLKPLSPEYYFVLGQWHLQRSMGDAGGYFTLLFRKIKGEWLIIVDHSS